MLFTGLWWDHLIKLDINLATCMVLSQSLEFNYGNFKTGSLETTQGLKTCSCPTGISKSYAIGRHCCHRLSACAASWDVWARVPILYGTDQMPVTFLLGNGYPEESPQLWCFFKAHVRIRLRDMLRICIDIQKSKTFFSAIFQGTCTDVCPSAAWSWLTCTGPEQMEFSTMESICMRGLFFHTASHSQLFYLFCNHQLLLMQAALFLCKPPRAQEPTHCSVHRQAPS